MKHEADIVNLLLQLFDAKEFAAFVREGPGDWPGRDDNESPISASELEYALRKRRNWQTDRGRNERFIIVLDEIERVFPDHSQDSEVRKFVRASGALRSLSQAATGRFVSIIAADLRPTSTHEPPGSERYQPFLQLLSGNSASAPACIGGQRNAALDRPRDGYCFSLAGLRSRAA